MRLASVPGSRFPGGEPLNPWCFPSGCRVFVIPGEPLGLCLMVYDNEAAYGKVANAQ